MEIFNRTSKTLHFFQETPGTSSEETPGTSSEEVPGKWKNGVNIEPNEKKVLETKNLVMTWGTPVMYLYGNHLTLDINRIVLLYRFAWTVGSLYFERSGGGITVQEFKLVRGNIRITNSTNKSFILETEKGSVVVNPQSFYILKKPLVSIYNDEGIMIGVFDKEGKNLIDTSVQFNLCGYNTEGIEINIR